jgi:hypothetical protein
MEAPSGQVVDTPSAQEFMRETLERVSERELWTIGDELARKASGFEALLADGRAGELGRADLRRVLRSVFSTRRRADAILDDLGPDRLAAEIDLLLHGSAGPGERIARFDETLAAHGEAAFDLPFELLHFTYPERYWLWTRWMWNPRTATGALPLVAADEVDLTGTSRGETYTKVGQAVAFVNETGKAAGFTTMADGLLGIDVFLACVYAVYMFTVLRMRMTQEFTKIVPDLPDLVRRLLGVYRLEVS